MKEFLEGETGGNAASGFFSGQSLILQAGSRLTTFAAFVTINYLNSP